MKNSYFGPIAEREKHRYRIRAGNGSMRALIPSSLVQMISFPSFTDMEPHKNNWRSAVRMLVIYTVNFLKSVSRFLSRNYQNIFSSTSTYITRLIFVWFLKEYKWILHVNQSLRQSSLQKRVLNWLSAAAKTCRKKNTLSTLYKLYHLGRRFSFEVQKSQSPLLSQ